LIDAWSHSDKAAALEVAVSSAVVDLFAAPYPPGGVEARGCTDPSTNPGTCTYADMATGTIYEVEVTKGGSGWYVTGVTRET
jgi:hypothetical protein